MRTEVVASAEQVSECTAVHRAAWGSARFTDELWYRMAAGPQFADARCLLARDQEGTAVATVTVWAAGPGRPALVEPLGVHPDFRRRGHGAAICLAAAAALRELGSSSVLVCTPSSLRSAVATVRVGRLPPPARPSRPGSPSPECRRIRMLDLLLTNGGGVDRRATAAGVAAGRRRHRTRRRRAYRPHPTVRAAEVRGRRGPGRDRTGLRPLAARGAGRGRAFPPRGRVAGSPPSSASPGAAPRTRPSAGWAGPASSPPNCHRPWPSCARDAPPSGGPCWSPARRRGSRARTARRSTPSWHPGSRAGATGRSRPRPSAPPTAVTRAGTSTGSARSRPTAG